MFLSCGLGYCCTLATCCFVLLFWCFGCLLVDLYCLLCGCLRVFGLVVCCLLVSVVLFCCVCYWFDFDCVGCLVLWCGWRDLFGFVELVWFGLILVVYDSGCAVCGLFGVFYGSNIWMCWF